MSDNTAETYKLLGYKIEIDYDQDRDSPRDWGRESTMICWSGRNTLGDEPEFGNGSAGSPSLDAEEYLMAMAENFDPGIEEWRDREDNRLYTKHGYTSTYKEALAELRDRVRARIERALDAHYLMLPLYVYEHGGITMNTGGYSCPWDSGQAGYIYITKKAALKEFGSHRGANGKSKILTRKLREEYLGYLKGEVEEYAQFLEGDVYCTSVTRKGKHIDSCCGYYGLDYAKSEAEAAVNFDHKERTETAYHERGYNVASGQWLRPSKTKCEKLFHAMQEALTHE